MNNMIAKSEQKNGDNTVLRNNIDVIMVKFYSFSLRNSATVKWYFFAVCVRITNTQHGLLMSRYASQRDGKWRNDAVQNNGAMLNNNVLRSCFAWKKEQLVFFLG